MRTVDSNEYHRELSMALDDSATAQQDFNNINNKACCLQFWASPLNNGRLGSSVGLPPGVIQLIHCMTEKCDTNKDMWTKCFCIKQEKTENKTECVQFFVTRHLKGKCPHRT
jgi:hypothetical protein